MNYLLRTGNWKFVACARALPLQIPRNVINHVSYAGKKRLRTEADLPSGLQDPLAATLPWCGALDSGDPGVLKCVNCCMSLPSLDISMNSVLRKISKCESGSSRYG